MRHNNDLGWKQSVRHDCSCSNDINGNDNKDIKQKMMLLLQAHNEISTKDRSNNFMSFVWMPLMHKAWSFPCLVHQLWQQHQTNKPKKLATAHSTSKQQQQCSRQSCNCHAIYMNALYHLLWCQGCQIWHQFDGLPFLMYLCKFLICSMCSTSLKSSCQYALMNFKPVWLSKNKDVCRNCPC